MLTLVFASALLIVTSVKGDCQCSDRNNIGVKIGNKRFILETHFKANFFTATEFCKSHNMQLAAINSAEENDALVKYILQLGYKGYYFWTSGSDLGKKGSFHWMSTGSPLTYKNFVPGEPNNYVGATGEVEHCIELVNKADQGYFWNDNICSSEKYFICESFECDSSTLHIN